MKDIDQFSSQRAADRLEIQHRVYQFFRGVDRLDFDAVRECYHPDAYDDHGAYKGGVDGFIAWLKNRHTTIPFSFHQIGNIYIEFASDSEALCESYGMTLQSVSPQANVLEQTDRDAATFDMLAAGRYVDLFTRRDGAWRIQRRTTIPEAAYRMPGENAGKVTFGAEFTKGTRDFADPSQLLRKQLGLLANSNGNSR